MDALERDFYEERRRKWRRSAFWRGVFATLAVLALIGIVSSVLFGGGPRFGSHIAHVDLSGVIYDNRARDALLHEVQTNDAAKALIVTINSPGGTTVGSEALYESLRRVAAVKPVVSVLGEVAASGGYIAALGTDHIVARGNSITGSIGVIMEYPDVSDFLDKLGVSMKTVRSSELKAEPSPFRKASPAAIAAEQALIDESYQWFRGLVEQRRGLTGAALDEVADGRVFTGRLALELGLIDTIGGIEKAREYLESRDSLERGLAVDTYDLDDYDGGFLGQAAKFLVKNGNLERISGQSGPRLYSIAK